MGSAISSPAVPAHVKELRDRWDVDVEGEGIPTLEDYITYTIREGVVYDDDGKPTGSTMPAEENKNQETAGLVNSAVRILTFYGNDGQKHTQTTAGTGSVVGKLPRNDGKVDVLIESNDHVVGDEIPAKSWLGGVDSRTQIQILTTNDGEWKPSNEPVKCTKVSEYRKVMEICQGQGMDISYLKCPMAKERAKELDVIVPTLPVPGEKEIIGAGYPGKVFEQSGLFDDKRTKKTVSMGEVVSNKDVLRTGDISHNAPTLPGMSGTHFAQKGAPHGTYSFVHHSRVTPSWFSNITGKPHTPNQAISTESSHYREVYKQYVYSQLPGEQKQRAKPYVDGAEENKDKGKS